MTKRISLLFFICILSALNINAEVFSGSCGTNGDNVKYSLDTETGALNITGTGAIVNYSYKGDTPWYSNKEYIKTVEISNGVASIGNNAFYYCSGLTSVTIPNSVTSIGDGAFYGCSGLTSIEIPNSVTSIGDYAFSGCYIEKKDFINNSSLDAAANSYWGATIVDSRNNGFVIKDGTLLKYTGDDASITIPNSVTRIGSSAFQNCSGLTSITIPNSVTSIGNQAFYNCSGLTSVTIPNSVTSIENSVFRGCKGLTSVTIPNSVTSIGINAFEGCSGLTSVTIPNSVTSIGFYAFQNCSGLTSVTIPNSVTSIGDYAFSGCSGLTKVTLNSNALASKSYSSSSTLRSIFGSQVKEYILGDDVTSIGSYAFYNCSKVTSVTIPHSVTSIGSQAFYNCSGLTSVTIPNSVKSIGDGAFYGCSGLTSIEISNCVTSIGDYAFSGCSSLTAIEIPNSVTSIGENAFKGCTSLASVTIPNSVTSIGSNAFYGCSGLTSVTIPNSVTSIGSSSFSGCYIEKKDFINNSSLDAAANSYWGATIVDSRNNGFVIKDGTLLKYTGDDASITIPNSVTQIGSSVFQNCSGLTSVTIPNSVTSIGSSTFSDCSGLTQVTLNSNAIASKSYSSSSTLRSIFGSQVKEYVLGDDVTSIGSYAFYNCSNVTSIIISDNVTSVGDKAFDGTAWYNNLPDGLFYAGKIAYKYQGTMPENTSMIIKEGIVKLNDNLFDGCTGLTSLYIPSSVKSIGNNAFANCTELLDVYCYARKSPAMGSNAFANSDIQFTTLYVPEASLNGYKVTEPWSGFGNIKALSGEYPEIPEITKCATPTIIFENGKLSFSCETEGVRFVCNFSTPSESYEEGAAVSMPNKLQVSVYAKKDGYENSDVATKEIDLGTSGLRGDLNNDGTVSMPDAMFIVNKILNGKFPDE